VWFRRRRRVEMNMVMGRRGWGRDGEWAIGVDGEWSTTTTKSSTSKRGPCAEWGQTWFHTRQSATPPLLARCTTLLEDRLSITGRRHRRRR
jgi:hypothetical protein